MITIILKVIISHDIFILFSVSESDSETEEVYYIKKNGVIIPIEVIKFGSILPWLVRGLPPMTQFVPL